ncbi:MAG: hypothetical protein IV086_10935 [Hyphomonadaceae bacterium]|nr:hypothetical protein [Hyphomonadaceae bacterium]
MFELEVQFEKGSLDSALAEIFRGEIMVRPSLMSSEEEGLRIGVSRPDEVIRLVESSAAFLWAPRCSYQITSVPNGTISVFAWASDFVVIDQVFHSLARLDVLFGFACAEDERKHRNWISRRMKYGVHEGWVGRDFRKYLPGLYWLTVIPRGMQEALGLHVSHLTQVAEEALLQGEKNWLLRLYENPLEWENAATHIDEWCFNTAGCFSKRAANEALGLSTNFIEASQVFAEWR